MPTLIISMFLSFSPPIPAPTFEQCFDQFTRQLEAINIAACDGSLTPNQARDRRLIAINDYMTCRHQAFAEWVRQKVREAYEILNY